MERNWTDPRHGKSWHIYTYNTTPAMATGGQVPDAGEEMIGFRHPCRSNPVEGYAKRFDGDPNTLTDSELKRLLDEARAG